MNWKFSEGLRFEVGNKLMYNFKMQFFSAAAIPVSLQSFKTILYTVPCWNFFSLSLSGEGLGPARRTSISCQHFKYKKQKRLTYKYDVWEETVRALCKNMSCMPSHPLHPSLPKTKESSVPVRVLSSYSSLGLITSNLKIVSSISSILNTNKKQFNVNVVF